METKMVDDDQHTVRFPHGHASAWEVVYWCGNVASGANDADRAEIKQFNPRFGYVQIGEYAMPDVSGELVKMLNILDKAHVAGMSARSAQIRTLLESH